MSPSGTIDLKTDLNQVIIFAKVVETRSFTAAGRALGLPKSTVSRKVAHLEERLGVQLLQRTTRKLSLTDVGAAFYERCARISSEIAEAEQAVLLAHDQPHGLLRITAPHELGAACLSDVVSEFLLEHREVDIELELTDRPVDLAEEGFDLAIRIDRSPDSSLVARRLGSMQVHLVASPAYLARRGEPERPEDLEEHDIVLAVGPGRRAQLDLVGPEGGRVVIQARPRLVANSVGMLREAILAGVGIGVLPAYRCTADIALGRLRSLLPEWTRSDTVIHALYPTSRHLSAKVRVFLDFLQGRLSPPTWMVEPLDGKDGVGVDGRERASSILLGSLD